MRIGHGFDAHRFADDRTLVLGGVRIPHHQGLEAHSDGDVIIHALCDALLGAAGLGDIGRQFPDDDAVYASVDSRQLLRRVAELIAERGLAVSFADLTIVAQQPQLSAFIDPMRDALSADLGIDRARLNAKATTTEQMGFTGRGEGIAAFAVVLLKE